MASRPILRLISSAPIDDRARFSGSAARTPPDGARPKRPALFRGDGAALLWGALASAALAPVALFLPLRSMVLGLFALGAVMCAAGAIRLLISSAYRETPAAGAFAIWALVTTCGGGLLIAAPLLAIARPMSALAFVLGLETAAVLNIARADHRRGSPWLIYAAASGALGVMTFLCQAIAPVWTVGFVFGLDLLVCGYALLRAGLAIERRVDGAGAG